jgi:hypothetical protein
MRMAMMAIAMLVAAPAPAHAPAPVPGPATVVLDKWEHMEISGRCELSSTGDIKKGYVHLNFEDKETEKLYVGHPAIPYVLQLGSIHVVAKVAGKKIGESYPPSHKFYNETNRYANLRDGIGSYYITTPNMTRGVLNALRDGVEISFSEKPMHKATFLIRFPDPKPLAAMLDCMKRRGFSRTIPRW